MTACTHCPSEFLTDTRLSCREGYSRIKLPTHYRKTWPQLPTLQPDLGLLHHHLTTALREHLILQLSADWRNTAAYLARSTRLLGEYFSFLLFAVLPMETRSLFFLQRSSPARRREKRSPNHKTGCRHALTQ